VGEIIVKRPCGFEIAVLSPTNRPETIASKGLLEAETTLNSTINLYSGFAPPVLSPFKINKVGGEVRHEGIR